MPLTDQELFEYFNYACIKYAQNNNDTNAEFLLTDAGDQNIKIIKWNGTSKQPTNDDLKQLSLADVQKVKQSTFVKDKLSVFTLPNYADADLENIVVPNYSVCYNTSQSKVQVYVNGVWKSISFD